MYIPKPFAMQDKESLFDFIDRNSFGIIVSNRGNVPVATHLPFVLNRDLECLTGHFAKANDQWRDMEGQEVLVIFQGPHHYISSSWYETNQSVPTWNYVAVHVYGTVEWMTDSEEVLASLDELVRKYESPEHKYKIDETNMVFVQHLMSGIVGFRVRIKRIEGKWKLSQNHPPERQKRVVEALERIPSEDAAEIARLMRNNLERSLPLRGIGGR